MLAGAYSNRFRLLQEQQLQKLKILNAAAGDAALGNDAAQQGNNNKNGTSRQLSLETNKRRKVQEKRQRMVALKEEKRRQEILLHRRQLQQDATERFQRAPIQHNKNRTTRANLEDLLSIIRGGSSLFCSTVPPTKQQRSSSARVLPKDRDKSSNNTPLYCANKLLNNRPSSQPSRTFPNAQLHDQSLKNLANSRNLFEQQLRQKLQQQIKPKACEQGVAVTPEGTEDTTDSENDLYSVDSVEAEARQDQVVEEQGHFIGSIERNGQKQKQAISNGDQNLGYKTESEAINIQLNPAGRGPRTCTHQQQHELQKEQQQQFPSDPHKNSPALTTLASGDGKNVPWTSQTNQNLSFQKTAWIQPSLNVNDNGVKNGVHQPMPAWTNPNEASPHFDNNVCPNNPRELNDNQNCSQQQMNRTVPLKGKPPICGAPVKPTIFQPKHNYYERQLSTTLHPITNNIPQQRPVRVNEKEQPYQEDQTRPQGHLDAAAATATNGKAVPYSQSRTHIPVSDKKKSEENKPKCPQQNRPIEYSERNFDEADEKSVNNNNAVVPQGHIETQGNPQPVTKSKTKKNDAWQESGRKTVSKKQPLTPTPPPPPPSVKGKPIRGILKVPSTGLSIGPAASSHRREIRDSLEITRLLFNKYPGETTEAKTRSKSGKKHVHFAAEDQFCELDDNFEMTSNVTEEKNPPSFDNKNYNNYNSHTQQQQQQQNGNVSLKLNINGKESDNRDVFLQKSWQKSQINWVHPNERPQAKAHIIKHPPPQVTEEGSKITDAATHSNVSFQDKKGNNERQPSSKSNNDVQYITMGTLKKMAATNNQGISNQKNPQTRKEIEATIPEELSSSFPKSDFPVDKTPTNDEITWLWDKVQMCLQQKASSRIAAPQTVVRSKPIMSQMYVDGGILGGKSNGFSVGGKAVPLSPFWHPPTCNGGVTAEGQTTANYAKKLALLHRRTSPPVPRVALTATGERVTPLPSESGTPPSIESRFPATTPKEVRGSLAVFLKAEELSHMVSVTDSQALVAMKEAEVGSQFQGGGAPPKYRGSPSILSLEEKRLMESLERINNKLKGGAPHYGQIAMNGLPKHLFLTDQLQGMKMPLTRYQISQSSAPSQAAPKGWLKGTEP